MTKTNLVILSPKKVQLKISYSRSSMYNKLNPKHPDHDPTFPPPLKLGNGRRIGFLEHEVDAWIESRALARDLQLHVGGV